MLGQWLTWQFAQGVLRHVLTWIGGGLVAGGWFTNTQWAQETGYLVSAAGLAFSAVSNHSKAKAQAVVAAVEAHPGITVIPAKEMPSGKPRVIVTPPSLTVSAMR